MGRERGSASTEYALLFVFLAVLSALAAAAMLKVISFQLPDFPEFPPPISSVSEE